MLFLSRQLNLKLQTGDRVEITIVETQDGGVTLGINAPDVKRLRKAIVEDGEIIAPKQFGTRGRKQSVTPPAPATQAPQQRRAAK